MRAVHSTLFSFFLMVILTQNISCKKPQETYVANILEQYFEQNILNSDFIVSYASVGNEDITAQYDGYIFRLLKKTYLDGPMTATKDGVTYTGTWSSTADYGKLVISITQPTPPAEFIFLNREWRFTEKALPVMKLAPWGSSADIVLHMKRQ
ncbi:MAG: hypothetical protein FGM46_06575 [Ferruginibacter sp.]|nr:hypothetical protein [Ferruginibacter sp.]